MRSTASDFRKVARTRLKGNWGIAILVCFVAALLGGIRGSSGLENVFSSSSSEYIQRLPPELVLLISQIAVIAALWGMLIFLVGGAVELGVCTFHTRLSLGEKPPFSALFSRFDIFVKALGLRLFMGLFVLLWSLLLIIPGIVAGYRYSMAPYLMAEYPQIGIREAVDRSKQLMDGNKGRLFGLHMSFIGWWLLSALTLGILGLWIMPYMQTAQACFYLELTGRSVVGSTGNQW